jgi:hypothetical protein
LADLLGCTVDNLGVPAFGLDQAMIAAFWGNAV